jgi:malate synthase
MPDLSPTPQRPPADDGLSVARPSVHEHARVLTPEALRFVAELVRRFRATRDELLKLRLIRQREIDAGNFPDFRRETATVRSSNWTVSPSPPAMAQAGVRVVPAALFADLDQALRARAGIVVADFEDTTSPTWHNCVEGQLNLCEMVGNDGVRGTLAMRPRGWHLEERHLRVDDEPAPAALVDFGLFFFHNAAALADTDAGPYLYLPKLESHLEARLWNDVFVYAQDALGLPPGTVRAAVLIETILAAFEVDEILYELRAHSAGLDCGKWDYVFSMIKRFRNHERFVLPDRSQVTMSRHMLSSYMDLIARTCQRRGVAALCTTTAQAHTPDRAVTPDDLLQVPAGTVTESGLRSNINVGTTYLESWLRGNGHVPIYGALEDTATAEVSRAQVWQWIRHATRMADGRTVTRSLVHEIIGEELEATTRSMGSERYRSGRFELAAKLFAEMTGSEEFPDFMTLLAYGYLD